MKKKKHHPMINPKDILATKVTKAGVKILIRIPNSKPKWVWRKEDKTKPSNSFEDYLTK